MRNVQIIIEYDGLNYVGWQNQKNGISIQYTLEQGLSILLKEDIKLIGSGRTDAGVHAYGQSANFYTASSIPIDKFPYAINTKLPKDIRVINAKERTMDFHSRYNAKKKVYQYKISVRPLGTALDINRVWQVKKHLDYSKMAKSLPLFLGSKDFTSFSSIHSASKDKVRNISKFEMESLGNNIIFTIEGNGFLYNMVRIIIGTIIEVGLSKIELDEVSKIFEYKDRTKAGKTAPPQGLYLKEVIY